MLVVAAHLSANRTQSFRRFLQLLPLLFRPSCNTTPTVKYFTQLTQCENCSKYPLEYSTWKFVKIRKNTLSRATLDPRYPDVMEYVKDAFPRIFITALSFSFWARQNLKLSLHIRCWISWGRRPSFCKSFPLLEHPLDHQYPCVASSSVMYTVQNWERN